MIRCWSKSLSMDLPTSLTPSQRYRVFFSAIGAWLMAGIIMAIPPLAARQAVASMGVTDEALRGRWFSWYVAAFLFGAAAGGFIFGWLGDRFGRAKALAWSVLTYSLMAGACYFVRTPEQLLVMWFIACLGVGGAWPNGISLASEAWAGASRPWLAGLFGTAANFGLIALAVLAAWWPITPESWRWVMLVAMTPAVLGIWILLAVPESPAWLARRSSTLPSSTAQRAEVFRWPLVKYTLIGILLGMVPHMGNWGATNWLVPWANQIEHQSHIEGLSAWTQGIKSTGAALGALLGGLAASLCGRRLAYFLISACSLASSFYLFHSLSPRDEMFLMWVFVQGFFATLYLGWLPLYLPELFPMRVRATGTGVAFNWGRIATAIGVLCGGQLMLAFDGSYARVGQVTSLIYAVGMIVICFAPDTSARTLDD
jgi:SHS family sialic acid transporter-like MFS transporter